jgi:hypothetical protein
MDLTLILAAIIGSWVVIWASWAFLNATKRPRAVVRSWQSQARVIQGRKIR